MCFEKPDWTTYLLIRVLKLFCYVLIIIILFILIFWLCCAQVVSLVPRPGSNLHPLYWKHGVLIIGPPGKPSGSCSPSLPERSDHVT